MKHILILLALIFSMAGVNAQTTSPEEDYQTGRAYYSVGDYSQALAQFQQAAVQGHLEALYQLSRMYRFGEGIGQDIPRQRRDELTLRVITQAAEQGHLEAQFELGYDYYNHYDSWDNSFIVRHNTKNAVYWYTKAALQGHALAQHNLGVMYENGEGVEEDATQAAYWYQQAAEQGVGKKNARWPAEIYNFLYSPSYAF